MTEHDPDDVCKWCGHPPCIGKHKREPHHGLCCLDGTRRPCWGPPLQQPLLDAQHQE